MPSESGSESGASADPVLAAAAGTYAAAADASRASLPGKRDLVRLYDPPGMHRAAALLHSGRSGSLLLGSYLDNHPDVVTLPRLSGEHIYRFHSLYPTLTLWEKLRVFPSYARLTNPVEGDLFPESPPADYYAAVEALHEAHGDRENGALDSSRSFFQFLHAAYAIGAGKVPANPRPLMAYAQHWVDQDLAERFIADFPQGRFVHAIRDPITSIDSWFDRQTELYLMESGGHPERSDRYLNPAVAALFTFLAWSRPHSGMEMRSCAVRFEDMHVAPAAMMAALSQWLGISNDPVLLESTWNGRPYVVQVGGRSWCGANPDNARRRSRNMSGVDRLLLFSLLHENFVEWNYPRPRALRWLPVRLLAMGSLLWLPTKLEFKNARLVHRLQFGPALRLGRTGFALRAPLFMLTVRLRIMLRMALEACVRLAGRRRLLRPL